MWTAARTEPLAYCPPWTASLKNRLSALTTRDRHVAYFYESPDSTMFRYRVFNMVEALLAAPHHGISASWFTHDDAGFFERFIDRADALVICRARYDTNIARIVTRARARGIKIFFDTDDLIFDVDRIHLIMDTVSESSHAQASWNNWFAYVSRLSATLRLCDAAIVTNPYLKQRLAESLPKIPIGIVPNFLNRRQQQISQEIWTRKLSSKFGRDRELHIGYFSGTPTHARDLQIAAPALAKLMDQDAHLTLRIVGLLEPKGALLRHIDRIERLPLQDFVNLQRLIGEAELNIAPLQDNAFTNCKSELKYFEAAIAGTLTVASPTYTFRNAIHDGENGFLARDGEWEMKIASAIAAIRDSTAHPAILERAYRHAQEHYGWDRHAGQIASAIFGGA